MDSNQQVSVLLSVLAIFWGNIYLASKNFTIEEAFFYHLSSLLSESESKLPLVFMSRMILDSHENIRLRKTSPYGQN